MFSQVCNSKDTKDFGNNLILFILSVLISTFLVRFFWNKSLVPHITVLKPITTLLDAFLLSIALNLLR
jgi:hypothetical protein